MNKMDLAIRHARISALTGKENNSMDQDGILVHDFLIHNYLIALKDMDEGVAAKLTNNLDTLWIRSI